MATDTIGILPVDIVVITKVDMTDMIHATAKFVVIPSRIRRFCRITTPTLATIVPNIQPFSEESLFSGTARFVTCKLVQTM